MKSFDDLNHGEKDLLLKFPVYVSMLAADKNDHLDKIEKKPPFNFVTLKPLPVTRFFQSFIMKPRKISRQTLMSSTIHSPGIKMKEKK